MIFNVPIYKTEAGVHSQNPSVGSFNSIVNGQVKPGIEVLIKFVAGAWQEVSTWDSTTKAATRTTNPVTGQTAYLAIPINDYTSGNSCCGVYNGSGTSFFNPNTGGSGGSSGGGRVQWNANTTTADAETYSKFFVLHYTNILNGGPIGVFASNNMAIDWGDGVLRKYTDGAFVIKNYGSTTAADIKVYHDDSPTALASMDDNGGHSATLSSITGDIPTALTNIQLSSGLPALPAGIPYTHLTNVGLGGTSLNTAALDAVLDAINAGTTTNGQFRALTSPRSNATLSKLQALAAKGWVVTAWGIAPNL